MFISEPMEAYLFNVRASQREIEESNELFAKTLRNSLHLNSAQIRDRVLDTYRIDGNAVVEYNRANMYCFV
jgi:hypothetical protein